MSLSSDVDPPYSLARVVDVDGSSSLLQPSNKRHPLSIMVCIPGSVTSITLLAGDRSVQSIGEAIRGCPTATLAHLPAGFCEPMF
jgi:hypothetical protein